MTKQQWLDHYHAIGKDAWSSHDTSTCPDCQARQRTNFMPYCTQNGGDCQTCALVNYGRDCMNNPVEKEDEKPE